MTGSSGVSNVERASGGVSIGPCRGPVPVLPTGRYGSLMRRPGFAGSADGILPWGIPESPCDGRPAGAILTGPSAPGRSRVSPILSRAGWILERRPTVPTTLPERPSFIHGDPRFG